MTDSERLLLIREALQLLRSSRDYVWGTSSLDDYIEFVDRVEIALADRIEVVFS